MHAQWARQDAALAEFDRSYAGRTISKRDAVRATTLLRQAGGDLETEREALRAAFAAMPQRRAGMNRGFGATRSPFD